MGVPRSLFAGLITLATSLAAGGAAADESHYVLVFASQAHPKHLSRAHTWVAFVRHDTGSPHLDVHTISWLPRTLKIRPFAIHPEPGGNLELHQTLAHVLADDQAVTMWGPYPVSAAAYARSLEVKGMLEGGLTQYRVFSPAADSRLANCNEAVLFVGPELGQRPYPLLRYGFRAGAYVARNARASSPAPPADHSWLIASLSLQQYPIRFVPVGQEEATGCPSPGASD